MKILFTGGYTLGSVTPLLAVAQELQCSMLHVTCSMMWVGTRTGPERRLVQGVGLKFAWIFAPKWRRYFDLRNIFTPFLLVVSVVWALFLVLLLRPKIIVTAGGFVGVPLVWAGWALRVPVLLHNLDARFSLANKLVAPFAREITCVWPETVPSKWQNKTICTGNPVREFILQGSTERGLQKCGFEKGLPVILIIGGGTGAKKLNELVVDALPELTKSYQVVHLTGKGKGVFPSPGLRPPSPRGRGEGEGQYCPIEFVTQEIADLYAAADLVITRAGMGALTEILALKKPMIIVPLPGTHQNDNARYLEKRKMAIVLDQDKINSNTLMQAIEKGLKVGKIADYSGTGVKQDAAQQLAKEILKLLITKPVQPSSRAEREIS